jgi:hypothetical protein
MKAMVNSPATDDLWLAAGFEPVNAPGTGALPNAIKNGTAIRQKIKALAPDQSSLDTFLSRMEGECAMAATKQGAMGGSQTAERISEDAGTMGDIGELARSAYHAASPHPLSWLRAAAPWFAKVDPNMRGAVLNEARKIVLGLTINGRISPDPADVAAFAKKMQAMGVKPDITGGITKALSRGGIPAQTGGEASATLPIQSVAPTAPAASSARTWRLAKEKSTGKLVLINPSTGETVPYVSN